MHRMNRIVEKRAQWMTEYVHRPTHTLPTHTPDNSVRWSIKPMVRRTLHVITPHDHVYLSHGYFDNLAICTFFSWSKRGSGSECSVKVGVWGRVL